MSVGNFPISVLIVDDEPVILDVISKLICEAGYNAITCDSPSKALELLMTNKFDTRQCKVLIEIIDYFCLRRRAMARESSTQSSVSFLNV
ncbi:MAG: response regulator [Nitrospirae bacterium]|nr:MAG: response regulator [Nitrospirota bacterium]